MALLDISAGTVGGLWQVASGHPLDTAKVRLQTQVTVAGQAPQYAGAIDALKKIWAQEGFGGLYKGVASPAMGVSAMNASMFFSYGQSRALLLRGEDRILSLNEILQAGFMTGFAISFVEGPFDNLKCKLQVRVVIVYSTSSHPRLSIRCVYFMMVFNWIASDCLSVNTSFVVFSLPLVTLSPKSRVHLAITPVCSTPAGALAFSMAGLAFIKACGRPLSAMHRPMRRIFGPMKVLGVR